MNDSMQIGDDVSPNLAIEVDIFNPKAKMTNKQRKVVLRARYKKYIRIGQGVKSASAGEKYVVKLSTLRFRQLIRRLKQAARLASHFKHTAARCEENNPGSLAALKFRALQDNALMCLTHIQTEIEYRHRNQELQEKVVE